MSKLFNQLKALYHTMDQTWDQIAAQYKFQCNGCEDNCCHSLFFHHTHIEKAYLYVGFSRLPKDEQKDILVKAEAYCTITFGQNNGLPPESQKAPCPLLKDGRCRLYQFRPMICRMHGLPHELHRPGAPVMKGPGCAAGHFENHKYAPFDRTPYYRDMAGIEMAFRTQTGQGGKIKQAIAQMLMDPPPTV